MAGFTRSKEIKAARGEDPGDAFRLAQENIEICVEHEYEDPGMYHQIAEIALAKAVFMFRNHQSPGSLIEEAEWVLDMAVTSDPKNRYLTETKAEVALLKGEWQDYEGMDPLPLFDESFRLYDDCRAMNPNNSLFRIGSCRVLLRKATYLLKRAQAAEEIIVDALKLLTSLTVQDVFRPEVQALEGAFFTLESRISQDAAASRQSRIRGQKLLFVALERNPFLKSEYAVYLDSDAVSVN